VIVRISMLQRVMPGSRSSDRGSNRHLIVVVVPGVGKSAARALATKARAVMSVAVRRPTLPTVSGDAMPGGRMCQEQRDASLPATPIARRKNVHVSSRQRPLLIYDGDCALCVRFVRVLERIGPDAEVAGWQVTDLAELGITEDQATRAVQWFEIEGEARSGHEAIAAMLNTAGLIWKIIGRLTLLPGVSGMTATVYRLVADNRYRSSGATPACARAPVRTQRP